MQKRSKRFPDDNMLVRWLTNCPVCLGKFSLRENWDLLHPRAVHLYSSVLEKAIIGNRKSTGAMMSPYLTPTLKSMDVSTLLMMSLTMHFLYMRFIDEHSLGGAPYFPSMAMGNAFLEVSNSLTRSVNAAHVGRLWMLIRCISVLIVNVPS